MSLLRCTTQTPRSPVLQLGLVMIFLSGCAIPPAVTVTSLVIDGLSYATTGKSTTDHAISAVMQEDCAILRAVEGDEICDSEGDILSKTKSLARSEAIFYDHGDFHLQWHRVGTESRPHEEAVRNSKSQ